MFDCPPQPTTSYEISNTINNMIIKILSETLTDKEHSGFYKIVSLLFESVTKNKDTDYAFGIFKKSYTQLNQDA